MSVSNDMVDHCQQLKKQDVPKNLKNDEEPVEKRSRQVRSGQLGSVASFLYFGNCCLVIDLVARGSRTLAKTIVLGRAAMAAASPYPRLGQLALRVVEALKIYRGRHFFQTFVGVQDGPECLQNADSEKRGLLTN
ncbi:hypothetical protein B0H14DRAFT_2558152 [Mycena olivaceomarginata]|nr:hypothetical protein B0H14DRAFT_2558152 [Mycena olivaceomarginata]